MWKIIKSDDSRKINPANDHMCLTGNTKLVLVAQSGIPDTGEAEAEGLLVTTCLGHGVRLKLA